MKKKLPGLIVKMQNTNLSILMLMPTKNSTEFVMMKKATTNIKEAEVIVVLVPIRILTQLIKTWK